ncbi:MAG: hypothetical protein EZS28_028762 [Streblomastix strix]|uniref:Uncharacterized protein n=1 Tax=Streblomastix strix TaxID=222440 RepID=A0A5J4UZX4_9EUKA|nr:MAG: hypothetical protein EZS28_028762 [Streblomastix strix]
MYEDPETRTQLIRSLEKQIREFGGAEELEAGMYRMSDEQNLWRMAFNAKQIKNKNMNKQSGLRKNFEDRQLKKQYE